MDYYTQTIQFLSFLHTHKTMSKPSQTLFALSIILIITSCYADSYTTSPSSSLCPNSLCGNISIHYPFWIKSQTTNTRNQFCGYPDFGLECSKNNKTIINLPSDTYYATDINYDNSSITLVDIDILDQKCPRVRKNVTLSNLPLSFSKLDLNLSFYFNCSSYPLNLDPIRCFRVSNNDKLKSYVFVDGDEGEVGYDNWKCEDHVVVSVKVDEVNDFVGSVGGLIKGFGAAVKKGFVLDWRKGFKDCAMCENSGGYCVFDEKTKNSTCICGNDSVVAKSCKKDKLNVGRKIVIGVGSVVLGAFAVIIAIYIYRRRKNKNKSYAKSYAQSRSLSSELTSKDLESGSQYFGRSQNFGVQHFTYSELEEATNFFDPSKELGEGGFGTVYYGKLYDGRSVAVKRLFENNYKRVEQFKNEVEILASLVHPNLVSLYGCTSRHSRELLLVYEYVSNGTVADHLRGKEAKHGKLTWPIRMNIAVETASALKYLHISEIIHRDIKTNNILLDGHFHVKVADFGLSRLFPYDQTHVSTAPQGTPGYVDPEYHQCYQLTDKSDVYSFGVVLIELISSLPAVDITRHRHEINLASMALNRIQNQALHEIVDPTLGFESDSKVKKMIVAMGELAFQCLQSSKDMRPSMDEVLESLKDIQNGGKHKSQPEVMDISSLSDDAVLLNNVPPPLSPDSNVRSNYTTPNTSG